MAITNPWEITPEVRDFRDYSINHAIMDQKAQQQETLKWWFELTKEWSSVYKTILNYEETLPSLSPQATNMAYYGSNYRLDSGLRILTDIQDTKNYEILRNHSMYPENKVDEVVQSIGMFHGVTIPASGRRVLFNPRTTNMKDVGRLFVSLCTSLCNSGYKSFYYRLFDYLVKQRDNKVRGDIDWTITRYEIRTEIFEMYILLNGDISIEAEDESFVIYTLGGFEYPTLNKFFGKLNGRKLTEEDIALYEMVHGYKPLFYNLEYKI